MPKLHGIRSLTESIFTVSPFAVAISGVTEYVNTGGNE